MNPKCEQKSCKVFDCVEEHVYFLPTFNLITIQALARGRKENSLALDQECKSFTQSIICTHSIFIAKLDIFDPIFSEINIKTSKFSIASIKVRTKNKTYIPFYRSRSLVRRSTSALAGRSRSRYSATSSGSSRRTGVLSPMDPRTPSSMLANPVQILMRGVVAPTTRKCCPIFSSPYVVRLGSFRQSALRCASSSLSKGEAQTLPHSSTTRHQTGSARYFGPLTPPPPTSSTSR